MADRPSGWRDVGRERYMIVDWRFRIADLGRFGASRGRFVSNKAYRSGRDGRDLRSQISNLRLSLGNRATQVSSCMQSEPNFLADEIAVSSPMNYGYGTPSPLACEKAKPIQSQFRRSCVPARLGERGRSPYLGSTSRFRLTPARRFLRMGRLLGWTKDNGL